MNFAKHDLGKSLPLRLKIWNRSRPDTAATRHTKRARSQQTSCARASGCRFWRRARERTVVVRPPDSCPVRVYMGAERASHTAFPRSAFGGTVAYHRSLAPPCSLIRNRDTR
eukprot:scaffold1234_cov76-Phaeocystis_antarctica.AAC.5